MAEKIRQSPDALELRGSPLASARLSRNAALAAVAVLAVVLGVIIVNVSREKPLKSADGDAAKALQPALNGGKSLSEVIPEWSAAPKPVAPPVLAPARASVRYVKRKSRDEDARLADTAVQKFSTDESDGGSDFGGTSVAGTSQDERTRRDSRRVAGGMQEAFDEESADEPDLNRQAQKLAFLQKTRKSAYLDSRLTAPVSPFELKTGTVIPSILISELNSDLPGEIIAQVAQNVYDTASGNHLLIPQGTKLFGVYDSQVAFGQGRLLVSWQRLIYPDAATLELGGMAGHDQEGKAGFADRVNNHYGRIFGWGLLTSVISAGYQLSQPQQSNLLVPTSDGQVAAAAVGQQMAELGAEMAKRNMQVQPTIEIRKGYRMNVMVNKDVIFPGSYQP